MEERQSVHETALTAKLDSISAEWTERVKSLEAETLSKNNEHVVRAEAQLSEFEQRITQKVEEISERFGAEYEKLEEKGRTASQILNLVAGQALGGQYEAERHSQLVVSTIWTSIGFGLLATLIAFGVFIFVTFGDDGGTSFSDATNRFLRQSPLIGALVAATTLVFRRAAHHRGREEQAKRIVNELSMLWPFISKLTDEQQNTVLQMIAPRYFPGGTANVQTPDDAAGLHEMTR